MENFIQKTVFIEKPFGKSRRVVLVSVHHFISVDGNCAASRLIGGGVSLIGIHVWIIAHIHVWTVNISVGFARYRKNYTEN